MLTARRALWLALPCRPAADGCPHNQYVVELTPRGNVIGRKVSFIARTARTRTGCPLPGVPRMKLAKSSVSIGGRG